VTKSTKRTDEPDPDGEPTTAAPSRPTPGTTPNNPAWDQLWRLLLRPRPEIFGDAADPPNPILAAHEILLEVAARRRAETESEACPDEDAEAGR
jgi:hypothetical protein